MACSHFLIPQPLLKSDMLRNSWWLGPQEICCVIKHSICHKTMLSFLCGRICHPGIEGSKAQTSQKNSGKNNNWPQKPLMMRSWNCSRFFWTHVKKSSSNYLEQKGNVMVFVAGIAHMPEGTARGTRTSDPRRGFSTTVLTVSLYPAFISAGLWLALFCTQALSNDGEDACWAPVLPPRLSSAASAEWENSFLPVQFYGRTLVFLTSCGKCSPTNLSRQKDGAPWFDRPGPCFLEPFAYLLVGSTLRRRL